MLTKDILQALKGYTENMQKSVTFVLQTGENPKRAELLEFLSAIAGVSDKLTLEERDSDELRSPISFLLEADGEDTGIRFSGIPSGHEFNSLILAMLQSAGTPMKLDDGLVKMVSRVSEPLHFEIFVSLSCHNCPDVVQAFNQFALINPNIKSEMIEGGVFQDLIAERDIQGVPVVYLNGEVFASGKQNASSLIDLLIEKYPAIAEASDDEPVELLPLQDVVVIGGGPAGASAAIYSARKGLKVTLIADTIGGQLTDTQGIENLIGVSKTTGPELTGSLVTHMNDYDINIRQDLRVNSIDSGEIKALHLSTGETVYSKTIVIATGARWRELGVPGEKENVGSGVAYCPHCDGPFFKGKDVAVIGGGNSGIEAALDLAGIVKSVTVLEFAPTLRADQVLVDQAEKRDNISIIKNAATQSIKAANGKVVGLDYQDRETEQVHDVELDGVFVQIGLIPNSQFVEGTLELSKFGEIIINEKCETSVPGIYACGDVTTVPYKQIIISMGEGAKASLASFEYLMVEGDRLEELYETEYLAEEKATA
jgi:alkyl hydroperoxide reductase subunit F